MCVNIFVDSVLLFANKWLVLFLTARAGTKVRLFMAASQGRLLTNIQCTPSHNPNVEPSNRSATVASPGTHHTNDVTSALFHGEHTNMTSLLHSFMANTQPMVASFIASKVKVVPFIFSSASVYVSLRVHAFSFSHSCASRCYLQPSPSSLPPPPPPCQPQPPFLHSNLND